MSTARSREAQMTLIRYEDKEAAKFVTPSGVIAVFATSIDHDLLHALKVKLERKLRRRGLLPAMRR